MEAAGLWVAVVAACAALAGAVFAYVQAKAATDTLADARDARDEARRARDESARLAGEANAAFIRQAEAQEEANRLKVREMTPPDWTGPRRISGDLYRLTNTSGGVLLVSEIDVQPDKFAGMLKIRAWQEDGRYAHGDVIEYLPFQSMGGGPEKITITYTKDGSDQQQHLLVRL